MFLLRKKGSIGLIYERPMNRTEWVECEPSFLSKSIKKPPKPIRVLAVSNALTQAGLLLV
jgi:hypothetical protein